MLWAALVSLNDRECAWLPPADNVPNRYLFYVSSFLNYLQKTYKLFTKNIYTMYTYLILKPIEGRHIKCTHIEDKVSFLKRLYSEIAEPDVNLCSYIIEVTDMQDIGNLHISRMRNLGDMYDVLFLPVL